MTEYNDNFPQSAQEEYAEYLASFENLRYWNTNKQDRIRNLFRKGQWIVVVPQEYSRAVVDLLH
jgi:hypothetical protein